MKKIVEILRDKVVFDFEKVDALFTKLLLAITGILSDPDVFQINEFVYVGEQKLAIETVAAAFDEENKFATPEIVSLVHDIAVLMNHDPNIYTKKLRVECRLIDSQENTAQGNILPDFKQIEFLFLGLLPLLEKVFYYSDMFLIRIYLNVGRYEIALNAIVGIFIQKEKFEKKKLVTPEIISLMHDLTIAMKRDPETYIGRLNLIR